MFFNLTVDLELVVTLDDVVLVVVDNEKNPDMEGARRGRRTNRCEVYLGFRLRGVQLLFFVVAVLVLFSSFASSVFSPLRLFGHRRRCFLRTDNETSFFSYSGVVKTSMRDH